MRTSSFCYAVPNRKLFSKCCLWIYNKNGCDAYQTVLVKIFYQDESSLAPVGPGLGLSALRSLYLILVEPILLINTSRWDAAFTQDPGESPLTLGPYLFTPRVTGVVYTSWKPRITAA